MRRGRSASVILTSPPLRAAEVRITTAPLRKEAQEGLANPESKKKQAVVLTVPMTVEVANKPVPGTGGRCTGRRAAARHSAYTAPRLRNEETCKQSGGTRYNPAPAPRNSPGTLLSGAGIIKVTLALIRRSLPPAISPCSGHRGPGPPYVP
jgi:hypothetical protein